MSRSAFRSMQSKTGASRMGLNSRVFQIPLKVCVIQENVKNKKAWFYFDLSLGQIRVLCLPLISSLSEEKCMY